jgi:hypothetical protein
MKKWIGPLLSILLIVAMILISTPFTNLHQGVIKNERRENHQFVRTQKMEEGEKKGELDSYTISLLKILREKVDEWLKTLNDRIEKENIARFEVRFLEILRNVLEWVREKIDALLEPSQEKKPEKRRVMSRDPFKNYFNFGIG